MGERRRWSGLTKATRDAVLFVAGLGGIAHTVLFHYDNPSTSLLLLYGGLIMGVPLLRLNELINREKEKGE